MGDREAKVSMILAILACTAIGVTSFIAFETPNRPQFHRQVTNMTSSYGRLYNSKDGVGLTTGQVWDKYKRDLAPHEQGNDGGQELSDRGKDMGKNEMGKGEKAEIRRHRVQRDASDKSLYYYTSGFSWSGAPGFAENHTIPEDNEIESKVNHQETTSRTSSSTDFHKIRHAMKKLGGGGLDFDVVQRMILDSTLTESDTRGKSDTSHSGHSNPHTSGSSDSASSSSSGHSEFYGRSSVTRSDHRFRPGSHNEIPRGRNVDGSVRSTSDNNNDERANGDLIPSFVSSSGHSSASKSTVPDSQETSSSEEDEDEENMDEQEPLVPQQQPTTKSKSFLGNEQNPRKSSGALDTAFPPNSRNSYVQFRPEPPAVDSSTSEPPSPAWDEWFIPEDGRHQEAENSASSDTSQSTLGTNPSGRESVNAMPGRKTVWKDNVEICYRTDDVLVVVAITCLVNFAFVLVVWGCVRSLSSNLKEKDFQPLDCEDGGDSVLYPDEPCWSPRRLSRDEVSLWDKSAHKKTMTSTSLYAFRSDNLHQAIMKRSRSHSMEDLRYISS